jgi:autotransporter strand-loop-strand O-heptosyltransferase
MIVVIMWWKIKWELFMQKDYFNCKIIGNNVIVKNLRDVSIECFINVYGVSYQPLIFSEFKFEPFQEQSIPLMITTFHDMDISNNLVIRIYENGVKIVDDFISHHIEKAYILISNDKYEGITQKLIEGLEKYSTIPILHYSINYDSTIISKNLTNIRFDVPGESDPQFMQFMKAPVFIDVIKRGVEHSVFLDSDIQVRPMIDDVFKLKQISDGPIIQRQRWDFVMANGLYIPGPLVRDYFGFGDDKKFQVYPNGITYLVIFKKEHLDLFEEWEKVCFSDEIQIIRKSEFLHDELLLNCLLWKRKMAPTLVYAGLNVRNVDDVKFFYHYPNISNDFLIDMNPFGLGHYSQSFIPFDKNDILLFHCVKDLEIANQINKTIEIEDSNSKSTDVYFKQKLIEFYTNIDNKKEIKKISTQFNILFHDGPFIEIKNATSEYEVSFIDRKTNYTLYKTRLGNNTWAKTSQKYYIDWKIIAQNGDHKFEYDLDYNQKRVFITFESSALGDTIAWIPYVEEFRKKWNCHVVCSTFWNNLFKEVYPNIEFIEPGLSTPNIFGIYRIGWFYDGDDIRPSNHKHNVRLQPMQKTASDILGLDYKEIRPDIKLKDDVIRENTISIAIHGTAQTKYWNNSTGWQEVTDYFRSIGYRVVILSKEGDGYMGNSHPVGAEKANTNSIEEVIDILQKSKLFIGIGSGLSWLSWATKTPTVLISGFSYDYTEPLDGVVRIGSPDGKCSGCFNNYKLDPGDWNWCPLHKGTERHFECSKSITSKMVIDRIISSGFLN